MTMQIRKGVYRFITFYILLMVALSANAQQGHREHIVAKGETLYRISLNYGVTIDDICRLNPQAAQSIKVGEKLIIPINE